MVKLSADRQTKEKLGLSVDVVTDSEAKQIVERLANDSSYKIGLSSDQLIIQRFLRD